MKKLKKLKLQSFDTLSNSEMKHIIGASNISGGYTCMLSNRSCYTSSGACGSIGSMGTCKVYGKMEYEYDQYGNSKTEETFTCYCDV